MNTSTLSAAADSKAAVDKMEEGQGFAAPTSMRSTSSSQRPATARSQVNRMHLCEFSFDSDGNKHCEIERYRDNHPLLYSMLCFEARRTRQLHTEGAKQINYPSQHQGWFRSIFLMEGRAIDHVLLPWCLVVGHAVAYTVLTHHGPSSSLFNKEASLRSWENFFGIALNGTLSLILAFRLNRAAARWWLARQFWGVLIAKCRTITSGVLLSPHSSQQQSYNRQDREETVRWTAAYCVSVMEFLRSCPVFNRDLFAGILNDPQVTLLEEQAHPPLFAAQQIRYYLRRALLDLDSNKSVAFGNTTTAPMSPLWMTTALASTEQLAILEKEWTVLLDQCGAMERIRATRLPIVYVTHLRTFLFMALLLYPYVWGDIWGWSTIPIVSLAAFLLLGIEAASMEVEQPFQKHRVNALNMDGFW